MNEQIAISRMRTPQSGRPTRETAQRRHEELLERALEMFSETGFELTTIDAIASSLSMTKRTIYARYKDKRALFEAAVVRSVERTAIPLDVLRSADTGDLQTTLAAIARLRVHNNLSPQGLRLQRIVTSEAFRFPEVYRTYLAGTISTIQFMIETFERHNDHDPEIWTGQLGFAASAFLNMINTPVRHALLFGAAPDQAWTDQFIDRAVHLFLYGLRVRA